MSIEPGQKAPDFTLPTDGNGSVTLSELAGKKVVLYFYPKDDTSGLWGSRRGRGRNF
jgi:peroxiredoxin Q/BCP